MAIKVGMISLGCSKNLVDGERMLYLLGEAGYEITAHTDLADVMVLNTCGFIDEAKAEAVENLLELTALKKEGTIKTLVVTGCLAERHRDEIIEEFPEVDALIGCGSYHEIVKGVELAMAKQNPRLFGDINEAVPQGGRMLSTPSYTAYVKIAEGCDNVCAYCVIPSLRGRFRSRAEEDILAECESLAAEGARELIIIAQDITRYGLDLYGERRLPRLLRAICAIKGVEWVRLHYLYPDGMTDELIDTIKNESKICRYLDLPLQHCDDGILKAMNRRYSGQEARALIARLRSEIPGVVLRTSIIAGLPGESEEKFEALAGFLKEMRLERAGVFAFSPQDGTPAADMPDQVDEEERERRRALLSELQGRIMDEYNERLIGKRMKVLCEGFDRYAEVYAGRTEADSPEVDGKIFFRLPEGESERPAAGSFVTVLVEENVDGDLYGLLVGREDGKEENL